MSQLETVAKLISECLNDCQESGFKSATLPHFLGEMGRTGHAEQEIPLVEVCVKHVLTEILSSQFGQIAPILKPR